MSADLFAAFNDLSTSHSQPVQKPGSHVSQHTPTTQTRQSKPQTTASEPLWQADDTGNDVLFDAEEESRDGDDEFGDFEDVTQHSAPVPLAIGSDRENAYVQLMPERQSGTQEDIDLLGLNDFAPGDEPRSEAVLTQTQQGYEAQNTFQKDHETRIDFDDGWGDFEAADAPADSRTAVMPVDVGSRLTKEQQQAPTEHAVESAAEREEAEAWDDFEDGPTPIPPPSKAPTRTARQPTRQPTQPNPIPSLPDDSEWASFDDSSQVPSVSTESAAQPSSTRPTNIPPPSILLPWLSQICTSLTATSNLPSHSAPPKPPTPTQIQTLHLLTSRILAARTQRWRRDTLLSQSLRISDISSSTSAGGKSSSAGGMKLSSLSKSENAREAREAAETLGVWNSAVPYFSSILRKANLPTYKLTLTLPLAIKPLASSQGGTTAAYFCPVCGMRREERVVGVDEASEDVFGEFWTEGWGHTACKRGWEDWSGLLRQR